MRGNIPGEPNAKFAIEHRPARAIDSDAGGELVSHMLMRQSRKLRSQLVQPLREIIPRLAGSTMKACIGQAIQHGAIPDAGKLAGRAQSRAPSSPRLQAVERSSRREQSRE